MKYYAIYKKDKFIAITDNKYYLSEYINNRKGKFHVLKIDEKELPDNIKNNFHFDDYSLTKYEGYYTDINLILTYMEYTALEDFMNDDAALLHHLLNKIFKQTEYIKFSKDEYKLIKYTLSYLIDFISSITDSNEVLYDECYDVSKFFYERFLKYYKKDNKNPYKS